MKAKYWKKVFSRPVRGNSAMKCKKITVARVEQILQQISSTVKSVNVFFQDIN